MPQKKSALGCQQLGPTAFRKVFRSFFGIFCKRQCAFTKSACSCGVMGPVPPRQTQPRQLRPGRQTPLGAVGVSSPCPGWLVIGRIVAGLPPRLPRSLFGCAPFSSELLYLPGRAEGKCPVLGAWRETPCGMFGAVRLPQISGRPSWALGFFGVPSENPSNLNYLIRGSLAEPPGNRNLKTRRPPLNFKERNCKGTLRNIKRSLREP